MNPQAVSSGPSPAGICTRILLLPLILLAGCHRPPVAIGAPQRCGSDHEERLIGAINIARLDRSIPTLEPHARLTTAAERHSADMARNEFIAHTGSDGSTFDSRIAAAGYRMWYSGEVVAYGYPSPVTVVAHWLRSPRHRYVLLSSEAVHIGAACLTDNKGVPYWTAVVGALLGI